MAAALRQPDDVRIWRQVTIWVGAGLCVAAVHGGIAWAVLNRPQTPIPMGEPPAAVMIELASVPLAPDVPPQDLAVGPQAAASDDAMPLEAKEEPETEKQPEPPKPAEPVPQPSPQMEPQAQAENPVLPEAPSNVVLPLREKPPEMPTPDAEKPPQKPQPVEKARPKPRPNRNAAVTAAPKPVPAARAKTNAASAAGASSSTSLTTWRGAMMAHLNRHKRAIGATGTVSVQFGIDRSGRVIFARVIGSSGNSALDREALALARRTSPVPAPPADVKGAQINLTFAIRFDR